MVSRDAVIATDEDEAIVIIDVALVRLRQPNVILDPLVRDDPSDKEDIDQAVAENFFEGGAPRRRRNPFSVDRDGHHACRCEPKVFQLLPIELGVTESEIDVADERSQFLTAQRREPEEARVVGGEECCRRDVVILKNASAIERGERLRHR